MTYISKKSQKGFTLVELAIVLVIIGLIVSGVLVGQDLIKAAELRATVRQHQEFQVAVNTFLGKYNGIPGDVDSAKYGLGGGCDGSADLGDGDGLIEDVAPGTTDARDTHNGEVSCFWGDLTTDGKELIKGVFNGHEGAASATTNDVVGENMPQMKVTQNGWGVFTDGSENYFITGVSGSNASDTYVTVNTFVPIDLFDIDNKIDDGLPLSGSVQARGAGADDPDTAAGSGAGASTNLCVNTSETPNEYQFDENTLLCNMRIKMETF
jgi:prepilin-type N-terminal cleavage/methylation domain-containing protein